MPVVYTKITVVNGEGEAVGLINPQPGMKTGLGTVKELGPAGAILVGDPVGSGTPPGWFSPHHVSVTEDEARKYGYPYTHGSIQVNTLGKPSRSTQDSELYILVGPNGKPMFFMQGH